MIYKKYNTIKLRTKLSKTCTELNWRILVFRINRVPSTSYYNVPFIFNLIVWPSKSYCQITRSCFGCLLFIQLFSPLLLISTHIYVKRVSRKQNNIRHLYFKLCGYIRPVVIVRLLQNFYILSLILIHRDRVIPKFVSVSRNVNFAYCI